MEIITKSAGETEKIGREFGNKLTGGEVVALVGNLGGGKTTFVQGLAMGLGINTRIISPTFILLRKYTTPNQVNLYHVDLYRLEEDVEKEIKDLGLEDVWGKKENVVVIEWADRIRGPIPVGIIEVKFEYVDENTRKISFQGN